MAAAGLFLGTPTSGALAATTLHPVSVQLTERPSPVPAGGLAVHLVRLSNNRNGPATAVLLLVHLTMHVGPAGPGTEPALVTSRPAACTAGAGSQICDVRRLGAGQTRTYRFTVQAPSSGSLQGQASFKRRTTVGPINGTTPVLVTPVAASAAPPPLL